MAKKIGIKAVSLISAGLMVLALAWGCFPGDTSGFKPEKQLSKQEIQKQIDLLKSNPKVPEGIRTMALKKLEKQMQTAE
jgi:hypothetical protein